MYVRNREPSIEELLSDPVARLVMARDGLSIEAVRALFAEAKERLDAGTSADNEETRSS